MASSLPSKRAHRRLRVSKYRKVKMNMLSNMMFGIIRGFGMAIGFSGLAFILLFIAQFIPLQKIPIIGDILVSIINKNRA